MFIKKIRNRSVIFASKIIYKIKYYFYKIKNRKKEKILVYTDSRGYEVTTLWNKRNPFSSYVGKLIKTYNVEYHICEHDSTTIIDFLYEYGKKIEKGNKYDYVIGHIGLVDFSPRPYSMAKNIIDNKKHKIRYLGWDPNLFYAYIKKAISPEIYNSESLSNLYSLEFFQTNVLNKLEQIDNFIYIGCNNILSNWRGNYWQDRPKDINIIMKYMDIVQNSKINGHIISIDSWGEREIKKYTVDNIHLNKCGYDVLYPQIIKIIKPID